MKFTTLNKTLKRIVDSKLPLAVKTNQIKQHLQETIKRVKEKKVALMVQKEEEQKAAEILTSINFTEYHSLFPRARSLKRKITLIVGPTNSGKTYQAFNRLTSHATGVYLSPLRLLAWEGKEEIEKRGFPCSLITGEEKYLTEGANFSAQTIETMDVDAILDCVLIDEIQMISDDKRGWAWTAALIGSPAKEIILTGAPESEPLITTIANVLGDDLEVIHLTRFNPLQVAQQPVTLTQAPAGTAFIAFSRKSVLAIKDSLVSAGKKVSVIYGNLSPELRRVEAEKFRNGQTDYLVATDAIAMGLNLPISQVVFTTTVKFNGVEEVRLTPTEVKQIGGRAGRYGLQSSGVVSAMTPGDTNFIQTHIYQHDPLLDYVFIRPNLPQVVNMGAILNSNQLYLILSFWQQKVKAEGLYQKNDLQEQLSLALRIDQRVKDLPLSEKFLFASAPVPGDDYFEIYIKWILSYYKHDEIKCPTMSDVTTYLPPALTRDRQLALEHYLKLLTLYSWLYFKLPEFFPEHEKVEIYKKATNQQIEILLNEENKQKQQAQTYYQKHQRPSKHKRRRW
jgi:ATP-dependent RNA helicase SUPV3L1/SUV3